MPGLIDATVTGWSETAAGEVPSSAEAIAHELQNSKRRLFTKVKQMTISESFVVSPTVTLQSGAVWDERSPEYGAPDVSEAHGIAWTSLDQNHWRFGELPRRLTRATKTTSTTVSAAAKLVRQYRRDERVRHMPPAARATYERIRKLREDIGRGEFDIVGAIRELRDGE